MEKLVTVYTALLIPQAELVKSVLEDNGISCLIQGAATFRQDINFGMGIQLKVYKDDEEKARKIIKDHNIK
ncbi:MAG: DUF2007 domain-containing protein [Candidatus Omnitrophota bacterium]